MRQPIRKMTLKGYKSIRCLEDFELAGINVLIGANGSGKSNLVSFFHLLREIVEGRLERAVNLAGGADSLLFLGPKVTKEIQVELEFGTNGYKFSLQPAADNRLIFGDERIKYEGRPGQTKDVDRSIGHGHGESKLKEQISQKRYNTAISKHVCDTISRWTVYHVHDTSDTAGMRRTCSVSDNMRLRVCPTRGQAAMPVLESVGRIGNPSHTVIRINRLVGQTLRPDGGNLAAFLYDLKDEDEESYRLIVDTVKLVAPCFKDFRFRPKKSKDDQIVQLEWEQEGSEYPFGPNQLSDGTLRFIALATALLQPRPPDTILIDEPEQIVVIDRHEGESTFKRLSEGELDAWLKDYTLGELWQKNVYGGGPAHD